MIWILPLLPALAGAALLAAGVKGRAALGTIACAALVGTACLAASGAALFWDARILWSDTLVLSAALPPFAAVMSVLAALIAAPVVAYAAAHENRRGLARLIALLLVFVGAMELLVIAGDFLTLLIGWEIVGACSWALISHEWRDPENPRAGLYAFIATRLGDIGLFIAAMALFAGAASFDFAALADLKSPYLEIAAFGVLVSAASKSGQLPFSPWLFRAMSGPVSVSALLHAAAMVAAGAYLIARLEPDLREASGFSRAAFSIGLATAIAGGLVAVLQDHAKKLLAASTSAHFGLMFVAVGAGYPAVALLHLIAHAVFKAPLFLAAGVAGERAGGYALDRMGFGKALPWIAAAGGVAALALAGAPPLGGGWTKEAIVSAASHKNFWLGVAVMLAGALSAAYAARFQLLAFGFSESAPAAIDPARAERLAIGALAAGSLGLGILWFPSVHAAFGHALGGEIPKSKPSELALSLVLIAAGVLAGAYLARRCAGLGKAGSAAVGANWFGLPAAIDAGIVVPAQKAALLAAQADDRIIDVFPKCAAGAGTFIATALAGADQKIVDCGVRRAGAFGEWLARVSAKIGESISDGLPEGAARLAGQSGRDTLRLQSGLPHRYYAVLAAGALAAVLIMIFGT